jgi:hypothetical protein
MKTKFRRFVSKCYRTTEFVFKSCAITAIRKVTFRTNVSLNLTFDSTLSVDGTGAQLQRIISVYALAKYFGLNFIPSEIKQVSIHPLDPFQTNELYADYLAQLNEFIVFQELNNREKSHADPEIYEVHFWKFMFLLLRNIVHTETRTLSVLEPYSVTEFKTDIMSNAAKSISAGPREATRLEQPSIVIHYRQGVGGFVLYPGQNVARETPLAQFEAVLHSIFSRISPNAIKGLVILTDAPTEITLYYPPENQKVLWEGTPGFSEGVMTIHPITFDLLAEKFGVPVDIIRGGNPLDAIDMMAQADFLLMSKSSLSYLGGFLNKQGQVYYPKDFWHRPLPGWKGF